MTDEENNSDERMQEKRRGTRAKEVTDRDERGKRVSRKRGETVTKEGRESHERLTREWGKTGEKQ